MDDGTIQSALRYAQRPPELSKLMDDAADRIDALERVVVEIAPWLSASLTHKPYGRGDDVGPEYRKACEDVMELAIKITPPQQP